MWGEPCEKTYGPYTVGFQLTRPVWGEPYVVVTTCVYKRISTHSPRVGRTDRCVDIYRLCAISTHSPRVGRTAIAVYVAVSRFISTHSPRVGRTPSATSIFGGLDISTHSPRVGRTLPYFIGYLPYSISTHSPRVGRTQRMINPTVDTIEFQLTRPVWGEPQWHNQCEDTKTISTHSPRVGRTHGVQCV